MYNINDWNLILVNSTNGLDKKYFYNLNLQIIQKKYMLDKRIICSTNKMLQDSIKYGYNLFIFSAYRDIFKQISVLEKQIKKYLSNGYSLSNSTNLSLKAIAIPGFSEHHTGLAIDIASKNNEIYDNIEFENTNEYIWLKNNAHKYGYILRYPKDKTNITNIYFEPWHFRYVGTEVANIIYNENLCLEEFIQKHAK